MDRLEKPIWKKTTVSSKKKSQPQPAFKQAKYMGQYKAEAKKMLNNPTRFLDRFAEGKTDLDYDALSAETSHLENVIENFRTKSEETFEKKFSVFERKRQHSKTKSLLINIGSSEALSSDPWRKFKNPGLEHDEENATEALDGEIDKVFQDFLDEVRNQDFRNIMTWLETPPNQYEEVLPFGLPSSLNENVIKHNIKQNEPSDKILKQFCDKACDEFFMVDALYHSKWESLSENLMKNYGEIKESKWDIKDICLLHYSLHFLLGRFRQMYALEQSVQKELMKKLFPNYDTEEIIKQKYRLKVKKIFEEKRSSLVLDWIREKMALARQINRAYNSICKQQEMKAELLKERQSHTKACEFWEKQLEKARADRSKRVKELEEATKPYIEEQLRKDTKRKEMIERYRELQQDKLQKYKETCNKSVSERTESDIALRRKLKEEEHVRAHYNRSRVDMRNAMYNKKKELRREMEKRKLQEQQSRLARMNKSKEKFEFEFKPGKFLEDTSASLCRKIKNQCLDDESVIEEEVTTMSNFFREMYSFSDSTIWSDRRVRLESRLREAGLMDGTYAQQVLLSMQPQPKPHLKSQITWDD